MFRSEDGYQELTHVVKVPMKLLKDQNAALRSYKYHVESPLTQKGHISSLEFIAGIKTRSGQVINRSLRLHMQINMLQSGCELYIHLYVYVLIIIK